ncbi:hypothetical protein KM043_011927 [Ampulex compressa]|nr:hypothetical protein KM043_011927 [Ampulex compressa]
MNTHDMKDPRSASSRRFPRRKSPEGFGARRLLIEARSDYFQYNLDFRGLSARGAGGSPYRGGEGGGADGDGGGAGVDGSKTGSAPGSDPSV